MKRILITGGFGFLGSYVAEQLLTDPENQVHVVDNLSSNPLPLERLLDEIGHERLTYTIDDLQQLCRTWAGKPFDDIYHLASVVGPAGVLPHAGRIAASLIAEAMAIADFTLAQNARLLFVSTSEIYGGGNEGLCQEGMAKIITSKVSPRLEYAAGKLSAEIAILNLARAKGLRASVVRPFNISGPRQSGKGGFVLPRFLGQALLGKDITVFGDGSQIRAFTYAGDIASGIILALEKGDSGQIYNLGAATNRCTILQLAEDVKRIANSKSKIIYVDPKTIYGPLYEEAMDKYPDAQKAAREIGWHSERSREEIISATCDYMKLLDPSTFEHLIG